jgi:hypothetical protein
MKGWTRGAGLAIMIAVLVLAGCNKKQGGESGANMASLGSGTGSAAGTRWAVPKRWVPQGERPMRAATYAIPEEEGDPEKGECAVFYFGSGQGGDVQSNINRWIGQFETSGVPAQSEREVSGMKLTLVQIAGAYLAPAGPMMQSTGKKENYRLLGAIVEAPEGLVFFKLVGPARTITAAEGEFHAMIASLAKL